MERDLEVIANVSRPLDGDYKNQKAVLIILLKT